MTLAGKVAQVKVGGTAVAVLAEATTTTDDTNYQITDTTRRVFDPTVSVTVNDGGVPTVEAFTLNRLTGTVTFGSANPARVITVDYSYLPVAVLAEAKEFSLSVSAANEADNAFGDSWVTRVQTLKDVSGSLGRWKIVDETLYNNLVNATVGLIEFYSDGADTFPRWRAWTLLSSWDMSAGVTGLIEESIDFEGVHDNDENVIANVS